MYSIHYLEVKISVGADGYQRNLEDLGFEEECGSSIEDGSSQIKRTSYYLP